MHLNDQKEAFSQAYVRAVASVAGLICSKQELDRDSIDISFKSVKSPYIYIEAQLKSTSQSDVVRGDEIHYPLSLKNYDDLRCERTIMPRILIVLILPDKRAEVEKAEYWIKQTSEQLSLCKCAYWISLKGLPETKNQASITVRIPMDEKHIFKPSVLSGILADFEASICRE